MQQFCCFLLQKGFIYWRRSGKISKRENSVHFFWGILRHYMSSFVSKMQKIHKFLNFDGLMRLESTKECFWFWTSFQKFQVQQVQCGFQWVLIIIILIENRIILKTLNVCALTNCVLSKFSRKWKFCVFWFLQKQRREFNSSVLKAISWSFCICGDFLPKVFKSRCFTQKVRKCKCFCCIPKKTI